MQSKGVKRCAVAPGIALLNGRVARAPWRIQVAASTNQLPKSCGSLQEIPPLGKSLAEMSVRPEVTIRATGGQRSRTARGSLGPSIEPGIWMSVNTARMSFLLSRIRIAPSASTASMASKPAFSTISIAVARVARLQPREQLVCGPQRLPVAAIHFSCGPHRLTRCAQKRSRSPGF